VQLQRGHRGIMGGPLRWPFLALAFWLLSATAQGYSSTGVVKLDDLPQEVRDTVALIREGGPFPYRKDGVTFGNRERLLPRAQRGYYREYTVPTPGARDRGARRIVAGGNGELYYTDDHYESFRRILE
jgi:ribonuclease T1